MTPSREVTLSRVTRQQEFTRSDLQKRIGEKQADSLRLLIVVAACGAFVAIATRPNLLNRRRSRRHQLKPRGSAGM
jgi:hypothetical protein